MARASKYSSQKVENDFRHHTQAVTMMKIKPIGESTPATFKIKMSERVKQMIRRRSRANRILVVVMAVSIGLSG